MYERQSLWSCMAILLDFAKWRLPRVTLAELKASATAISCFVFSRNTNGIVHANCFSCKCHFVKIAFVSEIVECYIATSNSWDIFHFELLGGLLNKWMGFHYDFKVIRLASWLELTVTEGDGVSSRRHDELSPRSLLRRSLFSLASAEPLGDELSLYLCILFAFASLWKSLP